MLDPALKTILHIPNVNSRESLKYNQREVEGITDALGHWQGVEPVTGFHRIALPAGQGGTRSG